MTEYQGKQVDSLLWAVNTQLKTHVYRDSETGHTMALVLPKKGATLDRRMFSREKGYKAKLEEFDLHKYTKVRSDQQTRDLETFMRVP